MLADKVRAQPIEHLAVLHGQATDVDELLELLADVIPRDEIVIGVVGPVIGTHAGPGVHRRDVPGRRGADRRPPRRRSTDSVSA